MSTLQRAQENEITFVFYYIVLHLYYKFPFKDSKVLSYLTDRRTK